MTTKRIKTELSDDIIDSSSSSNNRSELDVFTNVTEQDPIIGSHDVTYSPFTAIDNEGPLIYNIPASETLLTDLSGTTLELTVQVLNEDGTSLSVPPPNATATPAGPARSAIEGKAISVANDFGDSLLKQVSLLINGVRVGSSHQHHPQISVLRNILSFPTSVATCNLKHSLIWMVRSGYLINMTFKTTHFSLIEERNTGKPWRKIVVSS